MKHLMNFNKRKVALSLMAALAWGGVSSVSAEKLTEDFDNVSFTKDGVATTSWDGNGLSNGWIFEGGSSGYLYGAGDSYPGFGLTTGYNYTGKALVSNYGSSASSTYLIIPEKLVGDITFHVKRTSSSYTGKVSFYEVTEADGNYTIGSLINSYSSSSSTWTEGSINIGDDGKMIAINLFRIAFDNFSAEIYDEGGVKRPTNLAASNVTINSAELSWTAGADERAWQLVYSTDANFDKDAATPINVNATSYEMTNLDDNTTYYVAVRAYISETEQSKWTSTSFTTPLAPISQFPYTENFNDITTGIPTGWDNAEGTTTNASYKWTSYSSGHEGRCVRFDSYNNRYGTNMLKTPVMTFPAGETMKLNFWYKNPKGGDFSVYISNNGGATYETALVTGLTGATDWTEQTINIPEGFTENVVIVFKGTSNYGSGDAYIYLDDVEVAIATNNPATMDVTLEDADVPATVAFGNVGKATTKTFTVSNTGDQTLNATIAVSGDNAADFTLSANSIEVAGGKSATFTVTFASTDYDVEKTATVTLSAEGLESKTFAVTGTMIEVWIEEFEGGSLPTGWVANNWTVGTFSSYENKTNMALAPNGASAGTLITPRLSAKEGDVLSWDAYFKWADESLTVEYSNNLENWTNIQTVYGTESGEKGSGQVNYHKAMSFTAPAEGNYYLRFTSTYQNGVDNFEGFKLNLPDHIAEITASNIPASSSYSPSMKKGLSFNATVTVKESRGVEEELTAKFYMGEEVIGTSAGTVAANSTETLTIECTPTVAAPDGIAMHIEVEYAGGTLTTEPETRYVAEPAILELAEGNENEITTGTTYDVITMTRSFIAGWNTFIAPLNVNMSEFGEGVKVYSLSEYNEGQMKFSASSNVYAGTPYLINLPEDIENKVFTWENTSISSMNVGEENICSSRGDVTFQGVYSPIAKGSMPENSYVLTSASKIAKAGEKTSLKGFRAYFKTATAEAASRLSIAIDGVSTGINEMMIDGENTTEGIYNLQGQKMQQPRKGLNIVNGKKVIK